MPIKHCLFTNDAFVMLCQEVWNGSVKSLETWKIGVDLRSGDYYSRWLKAEMNKEDYEVIKCLKIAEED